MVKDEVMNTKVVSREPLKTKDLLCLIFSCFLLSFFVFFTVDLLNFDHMLRNFIRIPTTYDRTLGRHILIPIFRDLITMGFFKDVVTFTRYRRERFSHLSVTVVLL